MVCVVVASNALPVTDPVCELVSSKIGGRLFLSAAGRGGSRVLGSAMLLGGELPDAIKRIVSLVFLP